jgi:hypothetical protein
LKVIFLKTKELSSPSYGGRSRIRINKKGRKNSKPKRHGFIGKWVEPKLFTIYVVDEQGKKINSSEIPITNDGTYEEAQSKEWFVKVRKSLKKGKAKSLISQMDELIAVATGERCKIMVVKRNYILDAYRKGRLNYDKAIQKKLPIGSGAL